ncbi:unnamed protein product [Gongylonema pulchrum]|uniref:Ion_trans domain-containing protein n=1 Tax=Gongylonema pulchrum TaxID=637853 RepID=A0A183E156_9BILA|nr:unnamed protein product [Gongylonema pulchrum]
MLRHSSLHPKRFVDFLAIWYCSVQQPLSLFLSLLLTISTTSPRPAPISHRLFTSFTKISYRPVLFVIFVTELFIGVILLFLFVGNALYTRFIGSNEQAAAGNFRTILFVGLITFHILSLNVYIAVATMEMALLNGYMWIAAVSHSWGLNYQPFLVIFVNTVIRGTMIAIAVAARWSMAEMSHPTRTRDATEIYDATADLDNDVDHEDDAPIIYEMRRDVFT